MEISKVKLGGISKNKAQQRKMFFNSTAFLEKWNRVINKFGIIQSCLLILYWEHPWKLSRIPCHVIKACHFSKTTIVWEIQKSQLVSPKSFHLGAIGKLCCALPFHPSTGYIWEEGYISQCLFSQSRFSIERKEPASPKATLWIL